MIILIDQKEYAVGLNWFAISSTGEVEQFQKEMEMQHGILKMTKDPTEQSTVALCGPEYNGQVSLAGMLSFAYANLIYVTATEYKDENGEPLFYLCAVKNHAVTVDGDLIGTREEIQVNYAQNYTDVIAESDPNTVSCFGTGVDETLFPGVNLVESHHVMDPALRYASQATIKVLGKKELSKGVMAAGLILALGLCYVIYLWLKPPPPPPPPPPQPVVVAPAPKAPPPPPPPDPYKVFLRTFTETLSREPRVTVLPSIIGTVKTLPLSYDGWMVTSMEYAGDLPKDLNLKLDRAPYANLEDLLKLNDMGVFVDAKIDVSGNHASVSYPFTPGELEYIQTSVLPSLSKEGSPRYYQLVSVFQQNNITHTGATLEKNNYFAQTKVDLSGDGISSLQDICNLLLPFDTFGLRSVIITVNNGKYSWKLEGMIYG